MGSGRASPMAGACSGVGCEARAASRAPSSAGSSVTAPKWRGDTRGRGGTTASLCRIWRWGVLILVFPGVFGWSPVPPALHIPSKLGNKMLPINTHPPCREQFNLPGGQSRTQSVCLARRDAMAQGRHEAGGRISSDLDAEAFPVPQFPKWWGTGVPAQQGRVWSRLPPTRSTLWHGGCRDASNAQAEVRGWGSLI